MVREGVEMDSKEVRVINTGEIVTATEETINFSGKVRLHIVHPIKGWITKNFKLVSKITAAEAGSGLEGISGGTDSSRAVAQKTELEQLLQVEVHDNLNYCTRR